MTENSQTDDDSSVSVYVDFTPNHANNPLLVEHLRESIRAESEEKLEDIIARISQLPVIMVHLFGEYTDLLAEARKIYAEGYFYSCVAMCGIVGERLTKDILRAVTCVRVTGDKTAQPPAKAFDQLERVDLSSILQFLRESGVIEEQSAKKLLKLIELRNAYSHARGTSPEADALKAITYLHEFVESTVSALKHSVIRDGKFVAKQAED